MRQVEATPWFLPTCIAVIYLLVYCRDSTLRPFWLDEIIALYITKLPTLSAIWEALLDPVDGLPPLFYLVSRPVLATFGESELTFRLWPILGGLVATLSVFSFVRRRTSVMSGAVGALIFVQSGANHWFSEARPYAVCLGLAGLTLVFWQRSAEGGRRLRWLIGLGACIALVLSFHYYSLLIVAPILVGELVRFCERRKPDWGVVTAVVIGSSTIFLWLPILTAVRGNVAANAATFSYHGIPRIVNLYGTFATIVGTMPLVLLLFLAVALWGGHGLAPPGADRGLRRHETATAVALAFLPIIVFLVAIFVTQTFVLRYTLAFALGVGILVGETAWRLIRNRAAAATILVVVLAAHFYIMGLSHRGVQGHRHFQEEFRFMDDVPIDGPVVIAEGIIYPVMHYYAPPSWKGRIFYMLDLPGAEQYTDTSIERMMISMRPIAPNQILQREEFVRVHPEFLVYSTEAPGTSIIRVLLDRGCHLTLIKKRDSEQLFRCSCKSP